MTRDLSLYTILVTLLDLDVDRGLQAPVRVGRARHSLALIPDATTPCHDRLPSHHLSLLNFQQGLALPSFLFLLLVVLLVASFWTHRAGLGAGATQ